MGILLLGFPVHEATSKERTQNSYRDNTIIALLEPPQAPTNVSCASEVSKYPWTHKVALAVMSAESGGRPDEIGDSHLTFWENGIKYGESYGCMQIRYLPGRPIPEKLLDPVFNAEYAYHLYQKKGFQPWSVYKSGRYKDFL